MCDTLLLWVVATWEFRLFTLAINPQKITKLLVVLRYFLGAEG